MHLSLKQSIHLMPARLTVFNRLNNMIIQRTQEGKAIAKQKPDFREGRPKKFKREQINHALELLKDHSYKQVSAMTGISTATLGRAKRNVKIV